MSGTVSHLSLKERRRLGLRASSGHMYQQDKIWSRYSNDKVDIAGTLALVICVLNKALPLDIALRGLSIGSSNEPQFRILESVFRGGVHFLDVETVALEVIKERIRRQDIHHAHTIQGDYCIALQDAESALRFRRDYLADERMMLITLHHSLYYSPRSFWNVLLWNLYEYLLEIDHGLGPTGAIHAVLMAYHSDDRTSTTWLYNHFSERFFGHHNDQDLKSCAEELRGDMRFAGAEILNKVSRVTFFIEDFEIFMAVIWMILLHPNVHQFSEEQQCEVIEWVYEHIWSRGVPLVQMQDHLVIYRGKGIPGLI
jgi:hypothetical protein